MNAPCLVPHRFHRHAAFVCALSLLGLPGLGLAAKAHEHGLARLDLALDGSRLSLSLEMPMDSLVGFERAPRTPAERQALQQALAQLRDAATLWQPDPTAGCAPGPVTLSEPSFAAAGKQEAHADVDVAYEFACSRPEALRELQSGLFKAFSRLRRVEVQMATPRGQGKASLQPTRPRLTLPR